MGFGIFLLYLVVAHLLLGVIYIIIDICAAFYWNNWAWSD